MEDGVGFWTSECSDGVKFWLNFGNRLENLCQVRYCWWSIITRTSGEESISSFRLLPSLFLSWNILNFLLKLFFVKLLNSHIFSLPILCSLLTFILSWFWPYCVSSWEISKNHRISKIPVSKTKEINFLYDPRQSSKSSFDISINQFILIEKKTSFVNSQFKLVSKNWPKVSLEKSTENQHWKME